MPGNAFIKFDGVQKGESTHSSHNGDNGWIEISDWSWDIEADTSFLKGAGASVGKPQPGTLTFSHYYDSPAVKLLSRLNPTMTIGELIEMDRVQLGQYFSLHGVSIDSHRSNILINEITERLRSWDKHLAKRSAHVASS